MKDILQKLQSNRKTIYKYLGGIFLFVMIIYFTSPDQYESEISFISSTPEESAGASNILGQLSGVSGISLGAPSSTLFNPMLYSDLITSVPFLIKTSQQKFYSEIYEQELTIEEYFVNYHKPNIILRSIGWVFDLLPQKEEEKLVMDSTYFRVSKEYYKVLERIEERIEISIDDRSGIVYIIVEMPDPNMSALLASYIATYLNEYVIALNTQNESEKLSYLYSQKKILSGNYLASKDKLSNFINRNKSINNEAITLERRFLESEYSLAFELYKGIVKQIESVELEIRDKSPVIKVINPSVLPVRKSGPSLVVYFVLSIMLGVSIPTLLILKEDVWEFILSL